MIVLLLCLLLSERLRPGQVAMLLFACALAAEYSYSLRSREIVGFDISTEIHVAQLHPDARDAGTPLHRNDAYSAMLSITVLPSVLSAADRHLGR